MVDLVLAGLALDKLEAGVRLDEVTEIWPDEAKALLDRYEDLLLMRREDE